MSQKIADANGLFIFGLWDFSDPLQHNVTHIHKPKDISSLICQATVIYRNLHILTFQSMSSGASVQNKKYNERQITSQRACFYLFPFKGPMYRVDVLIHVHFSSFFWVFSLPSFKILGYRKIINRYKLQLPSWQTKWRCRRDTKQRWYKQTEQCVQCIKMHFHVFNDLHLLCTGTHTVGTWIK